MTRRICLSAACAAALAVVAVQAQAEAVWTTGSWQGGFTPAADNIALGLTKDTLTDGKADPGKCDGNYTVSFSSNGTKTFEFPDWMVIREVRIYATWGDDGRDKVSVTSVTATSVTSDEPLTLSPGAVSYDFNTDKAYGEFSNYAWLANSDGEPLAGGVTSLTVNFGAQENGYAGYAEIEIIGEIDTSLPRLAVAAHPEGIGETDPAYGLWNISERELTAAPVWTNSDESIVWHATGWKLYELVDSAYLLRQTGSGANCSYVKPDGGNVWKLEWQWQPHYRIAVAAGAGGSVTTSDDYALAGTEVTVTATPSDPDGYVAWSGPLPRGFAPNARAATFKVTGCVDVKANFAGVLWVDDDAETGGDGSADAPYPTIQAALAVAGSGAVIVVKAGEYQLDAEKTLSSAVVIQGETGDWRDAVVKAAAGKRRAFELNHDGAIVRGLTLKGTAGSANGVVYVTKGTLEDCRVTNGAAGRNSGWGSGVCNNGGTVRRCAIDANTAGGNIFSGLGLCQKAGLTEHCFITNNTYTAWHGALMHPCPAGAYVSGGTMRGCLIAGNNPGNMTESQSDGYNGFALYVAGTALVDGCSVVGNRVNYGIGALPTAAVYQEGDRATIRNCVIVDNLDSNGLDLSIAGLKRLDYSLLLSSEGVSGEGNRFESSGTYKWNAAGEFELEPLSAAVDAASPIDGVEYVLDLYGRARILDDGMDMGAAEHVSSGESASISIKTDSLQVYAGETSGFSVKAVGYPQGEKTYRWTLDGEAYSTEATCKVVWPSVFGDHVMAVTVESADGTVSLSDEAVVVVMSRDIYLDAANENPKYPYATPATAARNWDDVKTMLVEGGSLTVCPGTYSVGAEIPLSMPYVLKGCGNRDDIVMMRSGGGRLVSVTHSQAYVNGITFKGGSANGGGTMRLSGGGLVENCNVFGGDCGRNGEGGGCLWIEGATIRDSTIGNTRSGQDIHYGLGVHMNAGALVERCLITNVVNTAMHRSAIHAQGAAVHMSGGTLRNCLVARNTAYDDDEGEDRVFAAGVYQAGGEIQNCTITGNRSESGPGGYCRVGGTMVNSIVWGNANADVTGEYGDADIAGTAAEAMDHCWTSDPKFRNMEKDDWRLWRSSPAVNLGVKLDWMTDGATDLQGNPRVKGGVPDAGCYENPYLGLILMMR